MRNSLPTTAMRRVPVPTCHTLGLRGFNTPASPPVLLATTRPYSTPDPTDLVLYLSRKEFLQDATSALGPFQLLFGRSFQG